MKYRYAAKGVTKIFIAEVFSFVAFFFIGADLILTDLFGDPEQIPDAGLLAFFLCMAAAGVLLLAAGILRIIGYIQAAREEEGFFRAVICALVAFVLGFAAVLFQTQTGVLAWVHTILFAAGTIAEMFVLIAAIGGLINLSERCRRADLVRRGNTILTVLEIIYVLLFIVIILRQLFDGMKDVTVIFSVSVALGVIILVLMVIQAVLILGYLGKTAAMLRHTS